MVRPIIAKEIVFFSLDGISKMPIGRIIGNLVLSFASKMSTGYWKVFDPTNGFTAIHAEVARLLPRGSISGGFFPIITNLVKFFNTS